MNKTSAAVLGLVVLVLSLFSGAAIQNLISPETQVAVVLTSVVKSQTSLITNTAKYPADFGRAQALTNLLQQEFKNFTAAPDTEPLSFGGADAQPIVAPLLVLKSLATERKQAMLKLATQDPRAFLNLAIDPVTRSKYPAEVQPALEVKTTIQATIDVLYVDDFEKPENSHFVYTLNQNGKELKFYPSSELHLRSGAKLKISGYQLDTTLVANTDSPDTFALIEDAPPPDSVGDQKTLVILVNYLDSGPPPFTPEQAQPLFFNGPFQDFMREQSYGKVSFSGNVYGWLTLPTSGTGQSACGATDWDEPVLNSFIRGRGINLADYQRLVYAVTGTPGGACSEIGLSADTNRRFSQSWISLNRFELLSDRGTQPFAWTNLDYLLAHEVGHALGVMHANGWDCGAKSLRGDCHHVEYGNYFDTMGTNNYLLHFNAFYKKLLGWLTPANELVIDRAGRYTLDFLEQSAGDLNQPAPKKVLASFHSPFFVDIPLALETRQAAGFDRNLSRTDLAPNQSGLFVNKIISSSGTFSRLLDMAPTADPWLGDIKEVVLGSGKVFTDAGYGLQVSVESATPQAVSFDVDFSQPICVEKGDHGVYITSQPAGQVMFGLVSFWVTNADGPECGASRFAVSVDLPAAWSVNLWPASEALIKPGESFAGNFSFVAPVDVVEGERVVPLVVTNLGSGQSVTQSINLNIGVFKTPVISQLMPPSGAVNTSVKIIGRNFSPTKNDIIFSLSNDAGGQYMTLPSEPWPGGASDERVVTFTVPVWLHDWRDYLSPNLLTPNGDYLVFVSNNGGSNQMPFRVEAPPPAKPIVTTRCQLDEPRATISWSGPAGSNGDYLISLARAGTSFNSAGRAELLTSKTQIDSTELRYVVAPFTRPLVSLQSYEVKVAAGGAFSPVATFTAPNCWPPELLSLVPSSGPIGTSVTVVGRNFSPLANQLTFYPPGGDGISFSDLPSALWPEGWFGESMIKFNVPAEIKPDYCLTPECQNISVSPGNYLVTVRTDVGGQNGNSKPFQVEPLLPSRSPIPTLPRDNPITAPIPQAPSSNLPAPSSAPTPRFLNSTPLAASDGAYSGRVHLIWSAVNSSAVRYDLYRRLNNQDELVKANLISTNYDDYTATPGLTYQYFVKVYSADHQTYYTQSNLDNGSAKALQSRAGSSTNVGAGQTASLWEVLGSLFRW